MYTVQEHLKQMQEHIEQVKHNQKFHECIVNNFNSQFFDWKITVLFYVAIHCLKALAAKRKINIGETHHDIEKSVNPEKPNAIMRISKNAWREYKTLFNYSRTARYNGITDFATFEKLMEIDHSNCITHLDNFKNYIIGQGIKLPE
jgi:uncharacterized protein (UPF0332 family)